MNKFLLALIIILTLVLNINYFWFSEHFDGIVVFWSLFGLFICFSIYFLDIYKSKNENNRNAALSMCQKALSFSSLAILLCGLLLFLILTTGGGGGYGLDIFGVILMFFVGMVAIASFSIIIVFYPAYLLIKNNHSLSPIFFIILIILSILTVFSVSWTIKYKEIHDAETIKMNYYLGK